MARATRIAVRVAIVFGWVGDHLQAASWLSEDVVRCGRVNQVGWEEEMGEGMRTGEDDGGYDREEDGEEAHSGWLEPVLGVCVCDGSGKLEE
jgi:hypothetical protein